MHDVVPWEKRSNTQQDLFNEAANARSAAFLKMETVQNEGGRTVVREQEFYNLDVIIAVGYRVNSVMVTQFRIWARGA